MRSRIFPLVLLTAAACSDRDETASHLRTALVQYPSCEALEADLEAKYLAELDALVNGEGGWGWGWGGVEDGAAVPGTGGESGGRQEGTDFSGTNNQEEGVDEADLVKTDGYRLYLVNGNRLHIFGVPTFGELVPISQTVVEGQPTQLVIDAEHGRAAVFSQVFVEQLPEDHPIRQRVGRAETDSYAYWRVWSLAKVTLFDVSDPARPALVRELYIEGQYQTARRTDSSVRMGVYSWIYVPGLDDYWSYLYLPDGTMRTPEEARELAAARIRALTLDDLLHKVYVRNPDGTVEDHTTAGDACQSYYYPTDSSGRGTTSILSFDLAASTPALDADHIVSNWAVLYASRDRLVVAEAAWDWWWPSRELVPGELFVPKTNLHAFDVSEAGESRYIGSGRVDGVIHDQFSLDEEEGFLRVAATTRPWRVWDWSTTVEPPPPPEPESHVYVLEQQGAELVTIGHLGGIAPGEQIFAARFAGDKGYLVTFRQVDPLFTIDLRDPTAPRLAGDLEIPGFSNYIHPIAGDRLLTIGVGGDEGGADWSVTQVSLFDVSDFDRPARMDMEALSAAGDWSWSEAQYEHKAFQFWAPKGLLAVPLSSSTSWVDELGNYGWRYLSHLELVKVEAGSLSRHGTIDHSHFFDSDPDYYWSFPDVRRSVFMGDFIYAISDRGITVHRTDDLAFVTEEPLPGTRPEDVYWWW